MSNQLDALINIFSGNIPFSNVILSDAKEKANALNSILNSNYKSNAIVSFPNSTGFTLRKNGESEKVTRIDIIDETSIKLYTPNGERYVRANFIASGSANSKNIISELFKKYNTGEILVSSNLGEGGILRGDVLFNIGENKTLSISEALLASGNASYGTGPSYMTYANMQNKPLSSEDAWRLYSRHVQKANDFSDSKYNQENIKSKNKEEFKRLISGPQIKQPVKVEGANRKEGTFNSRDYKTPDNLPELKDKTNNDYTIKIGDVLLKIPPTHVTVAELRSSNSIEMIGFSSMPLPSYNVRIVFKINTVFSGRDIDNSLKRIITQFSYCPFNIIHSQDLYDLVISENSWLKESIGQSEGNNFVPVTMDEYTIYTIEGHPNSLGCSLQFSLFNYAAYFDGDKTELLSYSKMEFDDNGNGKVPVLGKRTTHLEEAIHAYNFQIEQILTNPYHKFFYSDKDADIDSMLLDKEHSDKQSTVSLYKLRSMVNMVDNSYTETRSSESTADLLCKSMSVRFENNFGWAPVIGYSQAVPQYIGPGSTTISLNSVMSLDEFDNNAKASKLSKLFKTYSEDIDKDIFNYYDDRFFVDSSITRLTNSLVCSIADVATTSLQNHPGYMDINITLRKSAYLSNLANNNRVAELDEYWGLNRVAKMVDRSPALTKIVNQTLEDDRNAALDAYGWLAKWNINSTGNTSLCTGINILLAQAINLVAGAIDNSGTDTEKNILEKLKLIDPVDINDTERLLKLLDNTRINGRSLKEIAITDGILYNIGQNYIAVKAIRFDAEGIIRASQAFNMPVIEAVTNYILTSPAEKANKEAKLKQISLDVQNFLYTLIRDFKGIFNPSYIHVADKFLQETSLTGQQSVNFDRYNIYIESNRKDLEALLNNILKPFGIFDGDKKGIFSDKVQEEKNAVMVFIQPQEGIKQEDIASFYKKFDTTAQKIDTGGYSLSFKELNNSLVIWQSQARSGVKKQFAKVVAEKDSTKNIKISDEIKSFSYTSIPFAAHRYYPLVDSLISPIGPSFSGTVGCWYYSKMKNDINHISETLNRYSDIVSKSISPLMDTEAYRNMFPKGHGAGAHKFYQKFEEENTPTHLIEALTFNSSRKNITTDSYTANQKEDPSLGAMTIFSTKSKSVLAFTKDTINRPFTGLSEFMFMSAYANRAAFGSGEISNIMKIASNKLTNNNSNVVNNKPSDKAKIVSGQGEQSSLSQFDANFFSQGVIGADGVLDKRSMTSMFQLTSVIPDKTSLTENIPKGHHYGALFPYLSLYRYAQSNPSAVNPIKDISVQTPTNPSYQDNSNSLTRSKSDLDTFITRVKTAILSESLNFLAGREDLANNIEKYINLSFKYPSETYSTNAYPDLEDIYIAIFSAISIFKREPRIIFYNGKIPKNTISKYSEIGSSKKYIFRYIELLNIQEIKSLGTEKKITALCAIFEYFLYYLMVSELKRIAEFDNTKGKTKFKSRIITDENWQNNIFGDNKDKGTFYVKQEDMVSSTPAEALFSAVTKELHGPYKEISLLNLIFPVIDSSSKLSDMMHIGMSIREGCAQANVKYGNNMAVEDLANSILSAISNKLDNNGFYKELGQSASTEVSNHTKTFMVNQILDSMLPTVGVENAFPTYKLYIIESGLSDIRMYALDNWYDFRLVQDMMVIKSKEQPAHILKCRVLVDERFVTTNLLVPQRDNDRAPIEKKLQNAPYQIINTKNDHMFYQGKVPLRAGMRVCLKLGYHTDPRMLDTVFIGTITGLGESMQKGMYELEALGDGRELSTPATNASSSIEGDNYADIISKMLRSNPSVVHFGRNFGSTIERFSREHLVLYGLCSAVANGTIDSGIQPWLLGAAGGAGLGFQKGATIMSRATLGARLTPISAGVTLGAALGSMAVGSAVSLYNASGYASDLNLKGKVTEEIKEKASSVFTKNSLTGNKLNIRNFINGHTFDLDKSIGQVWKHVYDTYKSGDDPIDDNIWAVDIWSSLTNLGDGEELIINNTRSAWDVLVDIRRLYPNYAMDVRPYGSRSTLYFGPINWLMWRTDDPVLAMMPQMGETSNTSVIDNMGKYFKELYKENSLGNKSDKPEGAHAQMVSFQKTHLATSDGNIIMNGIQSTPERGWNAVLVNDAKGATFPLVANSEIHPGAIKQKQFTLGWTSNGDKCLQYALGCLKEGVEKMYGGNLVLRGNPKIEPHDRIYIADKINKMFGWIEVETVIHKFDSNFGFTTHIVPNMLCAINSDAYKTDSQIIRSMATSDLAVRTLTSFFAGVGQGLVMGGAVAAVGLTGAPYLIVGGLGWLFFGYSVLDTATDIIHAGSKLKNGALGSNNTRIEDADIMEVLHASHVSAFEASALNSGTFFGFAIGVLLNISKKGNFTKDNFKLAGEGAWATIRSTFSKAYDFAVPDFVTTYGRSGVAAERYMTKMMKDVNKFYEKLGTGTKQSPTATFADAKVIAAAIDETDLSKVKDPKVKEMLEKLKTTIKATAEKADALGGKKTGFVDDFKGKSWNQMDAKIKSPVGKTFRAGMGLLGIQAVLSMMEAIPTMMETFMLNSLTRGNSITIYPLWHKNTLMIAGLDGWQSTNIFMHARNFITNARRVFSDIDKAVEYSMPTLRNSPPITPEQLRMYQKGQKEGASATKTLAAKVPDNVFAAVNGYRGTVRKAIEKYSYKIKALNCPAATEAFNENILLAIMQKESSGNQYANAAKGYDGQVAEGFGLMQLTWGPIANINKEMEDRGLPLFDAKQIKILGSKDREDFINVLTNNTDVSIYAGVSYFADRIVHEARKYGCDNTITERAAAAYNGGPEWRDAWKGKADPSNPNRSKEQIIKDYKAPKNIYPIAERYAKYKDAEVATVGVKVTIKKDILSILNMNSNVRTGDGTDALFGEAVSKGIDGTSAYHFKNENPTKNIAMINSGDVIAVYENNRISLMKVISKSNDILTIGEDISPIKVKVSKNENSFVKLDTSGKEFSKISIKGLIRSRIG